MAQFFPMSRTLLYNPIAESLVEARPRKIAESVWTQDLYCRIRSSTEFKRIASSEGDIVLMDPVTASDAPLIFFSTWQPRSDFAGGYDWVDVQSVDLLSGKMKVVCNPTTLPTPGGYSSAWIQTLVSAQGNGDHLICSIGLNKKTGANSARTEYWLCELAVRAPAVKKLTDLTPS